MVSSAELPVLLPELQQRAPCPQFCWLLKISVEGAGHSPDPLLFTVEQPETGRSSSMGSSWERGMCLSPNPVPQPLLGGAVTGQMLTRFPAPSPPSKHSLRASPAQGRPGILRVPCATNLGKQGSAFLSATPDAAILEPRAHCPPMHARPGSPLVLNPVGQVCKLHR